MCQYNQRSTNGADGTIPDPEAVCCPNCGASITLEDLEESDPNLGFPVCPHCQAQLPWTALDDAPFAEQYCRALLVRDGGARSSRCCEPSGAAMQPAPVRSG